MLLNSFRIFLKAFTIVTLILLGNYQYVRAQSPCDVQVRKYATRQRDFSSALLGLGGSLSNPALAVDNDPKTASSLNFVLGAVGLTYAEQVIDFNPSPGATSSSGSPTYTAGTPITIKLSLPASLLGVGTGIEIQAITNLRRTIALTDTWNYANVGLLYANSSLLNLINGAGDIEITITPTEAYQGVRVRLTSALGVSATAGLFGAYVLENSSATSSCDDAIDVLSGVKASAVGGLANATGTVLNPLNAIDQDFNFNTYSEISVGAQILSEVFHTTVFKTKGQAGDAIQMVLQNPGGGLLNLNLLNNVSIQLYNGPTAVGTAFAANSGLLSLTLLPGTTTNQKYRLLIPTAVAIGQFDRVEIKVGGLAGVGLVPGLRIYDVRRIILPTTLIGGMATTRTEICAGSTAPALSVQNIQSCTIYKWYTTATGGTPVHTGTSPYQPSSANLAAGNNIFYLEATRTNCTEVSERIADTIFVNALPTATLSGTATVCQSSTSPLITFTGAVGTAPYTFTYRINAGAATTVTTETGNSVTVPVPVTTAGTFTYTLISVKDSSRTQCSQNQSGNATITITPKPISPHLIITTNN